MLSESFTYIKDLLQAQVCYQYLITPIYLPISKEYREFAHKACEYIESKRSDVIHHNSPRHHVLHHFVPKHNANGKKILITHGWMSRAAYMARIIQVLHHHGYEVFAIDFPAHGDAKGIQLIWTEAVSIIKNTINQYGPFYGVIGHSYGGSMLLYTLSLSGQLPEWNLNSRPERVVLIASPVRMRSVFKSVAKRFKLSGTAFLQLRRLFHHQTNLDPRHTHLRRFISQAPETQILCIHGELDSTVTTQESVFLCNQYENARLSLLPDADHVSVLMDERVDHLVHQFME